MHSVLFAPTVEQADLLISELYEYGTAGLIEEGAFIRAFFEDETDYSDLLVRYDVLEMREELPLPQAVLEQECDPILAGEKFFIVPAASTHAAPPGRLRLEIHESTAFGTGRHETTQLMLAALEQTLRAGDQVLDVGAGTGILSEAARLLGAGKVWSCDIYQYGLRSGSREYRTSFVGSADAVLDDISDLTLANITPRVLDAIAHDLRRVTRAGGRVLISGFLADSHPKRFTPKSVWELNGWLCWLCERDGIDADSPPSEIVIHDQNWW